ncbi:MAG: HIT domain-containing protein [Candidatus Pacebacteria bacterium]|nr:HIT domain-containing protein [Candidatus Paceibacterota bacterium]MBP9851548.1 HIT domain-containing protein [Candidatus Paceibacterota bacterium]
MNEENCIFCKIVKGDIPSYKVYEDDKFLAFLDIFPATEGYTLVIPKEHFRWVWDVSNIGEYFEVCQKVAKHLSEVAGSPVYSMTLGEEVPHAHVRLFPANQDIKDALVEFTGKTKTKEPVSKEILETIRNKYSML